MLPQGGQHPPISLGPQPGPSHHSALSRAWEATRPQDPGLQRGGGGPGGPLRRPAASRGEAGEAGWRERCRRGPQRWSVGSCCWAGRELQRPGQQGRASSPEWRGPHGWGRGRVCHLSGVPQRTAGSEPAELALCQPTPGQSLLEGDPGPRRSVPLLPSLQRSPAASVPGADPACRIGHCWLARPGWAGTQTFRRLGRGPQQ